MKSLLSSGGVAYTPAFSSFRCPSAVCSPLGNEVCSVTLRFVEEQRVQEQTRVERMSVVECEGRRDGSS